MITFIAVSVGWLLLIVSIGSILLGVVAIARGVEPESSGVLILVACFIAIVAFFLIAQG